jgi:hypothetical protein
VWLHAIAGKCPSASVALRVWTAPARVSLRISLARISSASLRRSRSGHGSTLFAGTRHAHSNKDMSRRGTEGRRRTPAPALRAKKKEKQKRKSDAFRSKLKVAHAETGTKQARGTKQLKKKRRARSSGRLLDVSSLADTLQGLGEVEYGGSSLAMKNVTVKSSTQREHIMKEERGRMEAVLHHPVFKEDPFKAVMSHLTATLGENAKANAAAETRWRGDGAEME